MKTLSSKDATMITIKTNKTIGVRIAEIGKDGKESNIKTNAAWDLNQRTAFLLQCALADLKGSMEAHEAMDRLAHDWKGHAQTIADIEKELLR